MLIKNKLHKWRHKALRFWKMKKLAGIEWKWRRWRKMPMPLRSSWPMVRILTIMFGILRVTNPANKILSGMNRYRIQPIWPNRWASRWRRMALRLPVLWLCTRLCKRRGWLTKTKQVALFKSSLANNWGLVFWIDVTMMLQLLNGEVKNSTYKHGTISNIRV